ncbi:MAG: AraC family transcriptional regulator [Saprospiraceae bacterium]|nr:AraC family transcriptional regulator [Saprospiraceae bacterium]
MQYIKFAPSLPLKNLVECYYVWRSKDIIEPLWIDTPPTAFTAIVFNLERPHSVFLEGDKIFDLPQCFISGQSISNYTLKIQSKIDQIGIVFKPTGLSHLFDLQMFEFTNARENLNDVLKGEFVNMEEKLLEAPTDTRRIEYLEAILLNKLRNKSYVMDGVDRAANIIIDRYGNVSVSDLLEDAYMSRRKFERHFLKRVGLSPKYYARIRRYGTICMQIAGQRSVNWDEVLYQVGYYDQSHFIKDFKEFSGKSPSEYLLTNNELAIQ